MKSTIISICVSLILIGVATLLVRDGSNSRGSADLRENNVSIVEGKQIVEIHAKGGYQPRKSIAKAGVPTILRFDTDGTFDCSASVRIPSLNINKNLPASGTTDIDLGDQKQGVLQGMCGMGMYPFEIEFQN